MIRPITRDEIPACVGVIRTSFLTVADMLGFTREDAPRFTGFSISEERLFYQMDVEKRPMLCYAQNGDIVGYYSLSIRGEDCEINNLSVLPKMRHQGIGRELMEDGIKRAREAGCKNMVVCLIWPNVKLRKWYEGFGFETVEVRNESGFSFPIGYMKKRI